MTGVAEILKAIAWPVAAIILGLIFKPNLYTFLPALFRRQVNLELPGGFKVGVGAAEQQKNADELPQVTSDAVKLEERRPTNTLPAANRPFLVGKIEQNIYNELDNITDDKIGVLVLALAQARVDASFALIYANIFGSQISGLIELEARRKVTSAEASEFFLQYAKRHPEFYAGYGFSGWLQFLVFHEFVAHDGSEIVITPIGVDFVNWLRVKKLPTNKNW